MGGLWTLWKLMRSAVGWRESVAGARGTVDNLRNSASQFQTALFQRTRVRATEGDPQAQFEMGEYFYTGRGVPADFAEAARWFAQAAERGHAQAQCSIGLMYFLGRGRPRDPVEGYKWLLLSAGQHDAGGIIACAKARAKMSPDQRAEAEKLAQDLRDKRPPPPS